MIHFFGTFNLFKRNKIRSWDHCDICQSGQRHISFKSWVFFHIYFIPVIPISASLRVIRECERCGKGTHFTPENYDVLLNDRKTQLVSCLKQIESGQSSLALTGHQHRVDVVKGLRALLNDLYCTGEMDQVEVTASTLRRHGLTYESDLLLGYWFELTLQNQQAINAFRAANRTRPDAQLAIEKLNELEERERTA